MNKQDLRRVAKAARKEVEGKQALCAQACAHVLGLACYANAKVIFSYCAFGDELDVSALDAQAMADGKTLCYPICDGKGGMVAASCAQGSFCTDMYGIRAPKTQCAQPIDPQEIDLVLVPAVAFDWQGARLGYGAGYYDRYLPKCTKATTLGMAFAQQLLPDVCAQPHDCTMDYIVTPDGCRKTGD